MSERFNPFPGLRPFEPEETHLFFGREGQSDELLRRLREHRFLAVVGTSGSGKSSLVRAGLLPSLYSGFMRRAGSGWRVAILRPGADPIGNLARALGAAGVLYDDEADDERATITESVLRRGALGLVETVAEARLPAEENLLVVVDQFEELFRFQRATEDGGRLRDDAAAFVKLLLEASAQRRVPIYLAITMRSDYLGDCSQFRDLPEAINRGQYLIPRMTRDEQRLAITGPVAVAGGQIAPRLVNRLLNDAGDNPDQLPILQHALMRTWDRWLADGAPDEPLDIRQYEAIGGMADALSRHAEEAYAELPDGRSRELAEKAFRRLTERGPDNREIRRPTALGELCAIAESSEAEMLEVLERFRREGRSFLVPPAAVPLRAESLVDISHESLIRGWERLRAWVEEEAESARTYRRLAETATLYGAGRAGLWRDPDLELALEWWRRDRPNAAWARIYAPCFDEAAAFLEQSRAARDAEIAERERHRTRELRRTRAFVAVLAVLLVGSSVLALRAMQSGARAATAEEQGRIAALRGAANDADNYGTLGAFTGAALSNMPSPLYEYARALAFGYVGKPDSAINAYGKALEAAPEYLAARENRCDEYLNVGKADSAVLDCMLARAQEPHAPLVFLNLGVAYGMLGRYDAAIAAFDTAIASTRYQIYEGAEVVASPSLRRLTGREVLTLRGEEALTAFHYARASVLAYEGNRDFPHALAAADRQPPSFDAILNALNWSWLTHRSVADSAIPRDYGAFALEGALWERAGALPGALDEARARYRAFLRAYARRPEPRYASLARWARTRLWLHLAVPGASRVAVHPPADGVALSSLQLEAQRFRESGQYDSALARVNDALARRPGDLPLLADRAAIRFGMQAWDSLRVDADRLLAADSLLAMGYYYRAYANWMTDRARKRAAILRDLDRSLAYRPSLTGALSMKHWVLLDSAPDEALRLVEQAIRIEPGLHYAYMQLAIEQYHRGDFAGARRSSEAALMLKRDTTSYYDTRAAADQRLGMSKSEVFRRLAAGYRDVAQVLEQEGERERAIAAYVGSQTALRNNVPGTAYAEELKDTDARLAALGEDATHFASAWALIGRKQYAQALAADDSAIRIRPGYGLYYRTRATIDSLLGRRVDAAHDLVNAADVRLAHGDADGATQGYFAALTMLLVPRSPADTLRSAEDVAPIMVKVSKVVERKFGRDSVPVFYRARLADATWPAGWSPQSRDKLRQAIQAELARVSGAVASDGRAVSTPR